VLRALFTWKPSSARADLQTVLENGALGEGGFSPQERIMLTNIPCAARSQGGRVMVRAPTSSRCRKTFRSAS